MRNRINGAAWKSTLPLLVCFTLAALAAFGLSLVLKGTVPKAQDTQSFSKERTLLRSVERAVLAMQGEHEHVQKNEKSVADLARYFARAQAALTQRPATAYTPQQRGT